MPTSPPRCGGRRCANRLRSAPPYRSGHGAGNLFEHGGRKPMPVFRCALPLPSRSMRTWMGLPPWCAADFSPCRPKGGRNRCRSQVIGGLERGEHLGVVGGCHRQAQAMCQQWMHCRNVLDEHCARAGPRRCRAASRTPGNAMLASAVHTFSTPGNARLLPQQVAARRVCAWAANLGMFKRTARLRR